MAQTTPTLLRATFDDEFNTFTSSGNGSTGWMTSYPFYGQYGRNLYGESSYLSDAGSKYDPFSLNNGVLNITASAVPSGANPYNLPYNSGAITTNKTFAQTYGYFEVRAKLPAGQGLWPAFWMLPADDKTSTTAELDVFEVLGGNPSTLYTATHTTVTGTNVAAQQVVSVANTSTDFHTYGVDWEPTTITYYMDGKAISSTPTPSNMNRPMYMLLDLAVGAQGSWAGTPSSSFTSASMQVDYVRAYATANTVETRGTAALAAGSAASLNVAMPSFASAAVAASVAPDPKTASLSGTVLHTGQGDSGTAQAGIGVALVDANGRTLASAVTDVKGAFTFKNLAAGNYVLRYTAPSGSALAANGPANTTTGATQAITVGAAQAVTATTASVISTSNTFSMAASAVAVRGDGSYVVTGTAGADTLTLGNGDQTVNLGGWANTITLGAGKNIVSSGLGYAKVKTGSGGTTVISHGNANVFDTGAGTNVIAVDAGSVHNSFALNAAGQGVTTINGFGVSTYSTLDLTRTLSGLSVKHDLASLSKYVTAQSSGSNTTLYVDPTGKGGAGSAFAVLTNVTTTVSTLLGKGDLVWS